VRTLLDFYDRQRRQGPLAAMGIGKFGRASRLELARRGSVLNYAHLGSAAVPGQLSVRDLRRLLA
jgi:3-dehydroquinate dehydratase